MFGLGQELRSIQLDLDGVIANRSVSTITPAAAAGLPGVRGQSTNDDPPTANVRLKDGWTNWTIRNTWKTKHSINLSIELSINNINQLAGIYPLNKSTNPSNHIPTHPSTHQPIHHPFTLIHQSTLPTIPPSSHSIHPYTYPPTHRPFQPYPQAPHPQVHSNPPTHLNPPIHPFNHIPKLSPIHPQIH